MRILVTGSSGLVGRATAAHLASRGHEVIGLSRRGGEAPWKTIAADIAQPGLAARLETELGRCGAVVHAAASLSLSPYDAELSATNGAGTQQLLELARKWDASKFVYLSSLPVIGIPIDLPVTEDHPARPLTAYHASKLYAEHLVEVCGRIGLPTLSLRLTAPVGVDMPQDRILPVFVRRALAGDVLEVLGSGGRGQDYVDVRDVALAVEGSLEAGATGVLNVASGRCISNVDLARLCVGILGSGAEVRLTGGHHPEDETRWEVSIARAAREIGYRPQHRLEESIALLAGSRGSREDA